MRTLVVAFLVAAWLSCAAPSHAQYATGPTRSAPVQERSEILKKIGIDQKVGQQLPLGLPFNDENGQGVTLGTFFGGRRPVVLVLAYYQCPMLCTQVLNGMTGALKTLSLDAGKDFDVVVVSIDPKDNSRLAANKKLTYVEHYGRPESAGGWHFLTGAESAIAPLATRSGSVTSTTPTSSSTRTARPSTSPRHPASSRAICSASTSRRATCAWR